jgi:nitroimidazol reductase NimA-like FMN-containing flavoprotein (pyridoxamine 5'-phosphate oxidase superfamily)
VTPAQQPRTTLTRLRERQSTDRGQLDALLDSVLVGHFGVIDAGSPVVLPTAIARDGDAVLAHGSTGSRWLRALADGTPTCLTVTALDALVVARSAFESSMQYRSAVLFGTCTVVPDADKPAALDAITERLLPGRTAEIRPPTSKELQATIVLRLPILDWSLKVSHNWPDDPPEDVAGDAWAGVVPLLSTRGEPVAAPDLRAGVELPASLR